MALGETARGGGELGGSEIRGRRIDQVAGQRERLVRRGDEAHVCVGGRLEDGRALGAARTIALEAIGSIAEAQRNLSRFGIAEGLGQTIDAGRQPLGEPRRVPQRQGTLTLAQSSDGHANTAVRIRDRQHAVFLALEMVRAEPVRDSLALAFAPGLHFLLVQEPERNGGARFDGHAFILRSARARGGRGGSSINKKVPRQPRRVFDQSRAAATAAGLRSTSAAAAAAVLA